MGVWEGDFQEPVAEGKSLIKSNEGKYVFYGFCSKVISVAGRCDFLPTVELKQTQATPEGGDQPRGGPAPAWLS